MSKKSDQHPLEKAACDWIAFDELYTAAMKAMQLRDFPSSLVGGATRHVVYVNEPFQPEMLVLSADQAQSFTTWDYSFSDKSLAIQFMRCVAFAYASKAAPKINHLKLVQ